jgi:hypothetical protein
MCDEIGQQLEHLGPELEKHSGPPQIIAFGVEAIVAKPIVHPSPLPQDHASLPPSGACSIARKNS